MRKTPLKKYNKKSRDNRKKEREGFPEFYQKHIRYIKENNISCMNCGESLVGDVSEVAHVLPKSKFKSIATEDINILYLCGWKGSNCHAKFDSSSNRIFKEMPVFSTVSDKLDLLLEKAEEKINWKLLERYE